MADGGAFRIAASLREVSRSVGLRTCGADTGPLQNTCQNRTADAAAHIPHGLQNDVAAVNPELDFMEIRVVANLHPDIEIMMVLVSGRAVADHLALAVALLYFLVPLIHIGNAGNNVFEENNIGVHCLVVGLIGHKEAGRNTIDFFNVHDVLVLTDLSGNREVLQFLCILLPVCNLLLDLCHGSMSAIFKPGRKELYAILADLAVFQLFIAKHTHFFAADFTILLLKSVKKTHIFPPFLISDYSFQHISQDGYTCFFQMVCALFTHVQIVTDQKAPVADQPFADGAIIQILRRIPNG